MGLRFHVLYTPGLNLRAPEKASNLAQNRHEITRLAVEIGRPDCILEQLLNDCWLFPELRYARLDSLGDSPLVRQGGHFFICQINMELPIVVIGFSFNNHLQFRSPFISCSFCPIEFWKNVAETASHPSH